MEYNQEADMLSEESQEFFTSLGKSGGVKCISCGCWIRLPTKRKYKTPIRWQKCHNCEGSSKIALYDFKPKTRNKMHWIDVEIELPKIKMKKRFLAKCVNGDGSWLGIVDVYFDPHVGWMRCETTDKAALYVTHYTEHPYMEEENKKEE